MNRLKLSLLLGCLFLLSAVPARPAFLPSAAGLAAARGRSVSGPKGLSLSTGRTIKGRQMQPRASREVVRQTLGWLGLRQSLAFLTAEVVAGSLRGRHETSHKAGESKPGS